MGESIIHKAMVFRRGDHHVCALAPSVPAQLSRELASIAAELGIGVSPSTILRWVVRYTGDFVRRWSPFELVVGRSRRADETYIKVKGAWMFLYRAVDAHGRTVASYLSRTRDQAAARIFFRQAMKRHGEPRSITLDGFEPSHRALRRIVCETSSTSSA